jgi:uncharacterized oligopeptide transporter (OPT) family protein
MHVLVILGFIIIFSRVSFPYSFVCCKLNYAAFCFFRFYFDFSATYVGVGMICPYIVNASLLLGGVLSWGLMWPLISKMKGSWYPESLPDSSLHGLQAYKVI